MPKSLVLPENIASFLPTSHPEEEEEETKAMSGPLDSETGTGSLDSEAPDPVPNP